MTERRSLFAVVAILAVLVSSLMYPLKARGADVPEPAKCIVKNTPEEQKKTKKKFKEGAPCGDGLGKCHNDKCEIQGGGKMPMLPMLPMLPMPMPMPPPPPSDMPMQNCGASQTGNYVGGVFRSEGTQATGTTSTSTPSKADSNCPNNGNPYWDPYGVSQQQSVSSNINDNTSKTQQTATQNVSDLFNDLFGSNSNSDDTNNNSNGTSTHVQPTPAPTSTPRATPYVGNPGVIEINPGISGNIEFNNGGATIHISRESGGTTVAGFYGSNTTAQPTGVVQGWCASRPWTTNFLSKIIPAGFFDGLCTLRGYQVGVIPIASSSPRAPIVEVQRQPIISSTTNSFTSPPIQRGITPPKPQQPAAKADIWAVPSSVRLGGRATVFWSASNVTGCDETSPEGGFTHNTISGGAETVAISGPTTFVISCIGADGKHITNFTTINLSN